MQPRFQWSKNDGLKVRVRKMLRLLTVYYFCVVEYFQSTGANATKDKLVVQALRGNIRKLTGENEFDILYDSALKSDRFGRPSKAKRRCLGCCYKQERDTMGEETLPSRTVDEYATDEWLRRRGIGDGGQWRKEFIANRCNTVSHSNPMTVSHDAHLLTRVSLLTWLCKPD